MRGREARRSGCLETRGGRLRVDWVVHCAGSLLLVATFTYLVLLHLPALLCAGLWRHMELELPVLWGCRSPANRGFMMHAVLEILVGRELRAPRILAKHA